MGLLAKTFYSELFNKTIEQSNTLLVIMIRSLYSLHIEPKHQDTVKSMLHINKHILPTMIKTIFLLLCVSLFTNAYGSDSKPLSSSTGFSSSSTFDKPDLSLSIEDLPETTFEELVPDEEFLPVDEAYQLSVRNTENSLIAEWVIADAYYLYGEQFRFSFNGNTITATKPTGKISYDEVFEKEVEKHYHYIQAEIQKSDLSTPIDSNTLLVTYQGCADAGLCYPPQTREFRINADYSSVTAIPVVNRFAQTKPDNTSAENPVAKTNLEQQAKIDNTPNTQGLGFAAKIILFAIIGGMILNLMPCVFPVLSIKALSLANNHDRGSRIRHGWSYTLGCILTFIIVAGVLLLVRDAGRAVGWGFQLQAPAVITFLAFLFFVMGLSLSGFISFGTRWMSAGQSLTQGHGLQQSFFTGVLAAVVASPCTAPFMASALGYALTQPTVIALAIFAALGLGMALPFLLLSYLPQLSRFLPQPGAWMETFKQAVAFPLYLTSAWLLWVLGRQVGTDGIILVIIGAIGIVFAFWLAQRKPNLSTVTTIASVIIAASIIWATHHKPTISSQQTSLNNEFWQPYTPTGLSSLRQQGEAVFVNLTADWCITCKVNEKLVFTPTTLEKMKNKRIHLLQGDWTNYNAEITSLLEEYGRGGVPLYLLFPAEQNAKAIVLPQILRPSSFNQLIDEI